MNHLQPHNVRKRSPLLSRKHEIEDLNLILSRVFREYELDKSERDERKKQSDLMEHWIKCVGKEIAEETEPAGMRQNVLTIKVYSPVWYHHLSHVMKDTLFEKLKVSFPKLKKLQFKLHSKKQI